MCKELGHYRMLEKLGNEVNVHIECVYTKFLFTMNQVNDQITF